VLVFHELMNEVAQIVLVEVLCVRRFHRLQDATAISKEVRDDVRMADPGVLRLHVKNTSFVLDDFDDAEKRRDDFHGNDCAP
jgi:hypothetical protein